MERNVKRTEVPLNYDDNIILIWQMNKCQSVFFLLQIMNRFSFLMTIFSPLNQMQAHRWRYLRITNANGYNGRDIFFETKMEKIVVCRNFKNIFAHIETPTNDQNDRYTYVVRGNNLLSKGKKNWTKRENL